MVARGDSILSPALTRRFIERFVASPPPSNGLPSALAPLSRRELEVFDLLARGSSNAQIAQRLFLGEATVKTHVAQILAKPSIRDRVQAVVPAYMRPATSRPDPPVPRQRQPDELDQLASLSALPRRHLAPLQVAQVAAERQAGHHQKEHAHHDKHRPGDPQRTLTGAERRDDQHQQSADHPDPADHRRAGTHHPHEDVIEHLVQIDLSGARHATIVADGREGWRRPARQRVSNRAGIADSTALSPTRCTR
ncbi:response regulator transcription factor [Leekyejoonella antrihumi]|uniref:Response regulator transcription factor n=1 Tax=Leekyejoonella antrihumi TaxID=1660198 RepID=A0A563DUR4_9MICO|nr:response regulator transcription factor [Leekyejoonella antrihumi]